MSKSNTLSILFLKEGTSWVAQCLEHDIAAQGKNIREASYELQKAFCAEISVCEELGYNFFTANPPAPGYYWRIFDECGVTVSTNKAQKYHSASSPDLSLGEMRAA
ncbi:MAG: hypothetical protein AB2689_02150 [Candidatus Thiodiazotropha taylori]